MADKNANTVATLMFLVQQFILLLVTSGICAQIEYGTLKFEFKIHDKRVSHSKPSVELDIRAETTK